MVLGVGPVHHLDEFFLLVPEETHRLTSRRLLFLGASVYTLAKGEFHIPKIGTRLVQQAMEDEQ